MGIIKQSSLVKTYQRGEIQKFEVSFFEDSDQTIPMVSNDITSYPAYTIYDLSNNSITTGVGTLLIAGKWQARWSIPKEQELSADNRNYRIEWVLLDQYNRQVSFTQPFDIVDVIVERSSPNEQQLHTLAGKKYTFIYKTKVIPQSITLKVFLGQNENNTVLEDISYPDGALEMRTEDVWQIFYYTPSEPVLVQPGCYTALWQIETSDTVAPAYDYQIINTLPTEILQFISPVRMLIDKMQKKTKYIESYQDSDIIQYLTRGLEFINAWFPTSYYGVNNIPRPLHMAWVFAAGWYGLTAQHILETELTYDFSGQVDSFSFDHAAGLESTIGRMWEYFTTSLTPTKMQIHRTSNRIGASALRLQTMRGRNYSQQFVVPLGRGGIVGGSDTSQGNFAVFLGI